MNLFCRKNKSSGDRIVLDFRGTRGPVRVENKTRNRRSDTQKDDSSSLPPLPQTEPTPRKSQSCEPQSSRPPGDKGRGAEDSDLKGGAGFKLNPGKYSHLPVYDKEEERRKAKEREKKVTEIFSGEKMLRLR